MRIWAPWETAWPAGAALLLCLGAAWAVRAHLRPRQPAALVGLVLLGVAVRLVGLPAWTEHVYDGHEAEFYDIFVGQRAVNRGGTVLYPAMQWLWWALGRVLPHHPGVPVALMATVGAATAAVVSGFVTRLVEPGSGPRQADRMGLLAGLFVALHPVHAAWSSSAYNVVLPGFFGAVVLWSGAALGRSRRPPLGVAVLGASAWALVVATRMEAALVGLPAALLALGLRPADAPWRRVLASRLRWLGPLVVGLTLGGLAAWPLVYPGELPGTGERGLAFAINWPMLDLYLPGPWGPPLGALLVLLGARAAMRWPVVTGALVVGLGTNHLIMSTFDDLGDRHLLPMLPALAWLFAAGCLADRPPRPRRSAVAAALGIGLLVGGLVDLRGRYYASEEAFAAALDATHPELPRWRAAEARAGCGWINEDSRYAADPVASHFNVLDAAEAEALRGEGGCLRWCADVQDWRWSSRGVADRARRMHRLYELTPVAVVSEPASGYACLVWEVGPRRCCGARSDR